MGASRQTGNPPGEQDRLARRKPTLWLRAGVLQAIRRFFVEQGYLEVETPCLVPAPAPEAHIDAIPAEGGFLHTSPELCMKRLLACGYPKIFQICPCFRKAERGTQHLPQFTLLEWYRTGADYMGLMEECERMIRRVAAEVGAADGITYRNKKVHLGSPWERITVEEAFSRYASMPWEEALKTDRFDEIMVTRIEPCLGATRPTFLYDYPAPLAGLSRIKAEDPRFAERFELYIAGLEIANAFSELTDPLEQRRRFERDREGRRRDGKTVYPLSERFLEALPIMPDAAGIALGVDRLVMLLAGQPTIDQVVAFTPEEL